MVILLLVQILVLRVVQVVGNNMKRRNGFTLVELMISMAIIAVLSVVLSVSFSKAQKDGRDQRRISDLKSIQNAAEQMVLLSGTYPVSAGMYNNPNNSWSVGTQVVLQKIPSDPKIVNGVGITYMVSGVGSTSYCVCANIEVPKNANAGTNSCGFAQASDCLVSPSACFYCVKNQQ